MRVTSFLDSSLLRVSNPMDSTIVKKENISSQEEQIPKDSNELSPSEKAKISKLQSIDQKVRAHEAAHIAAGGSVIKSGANFTYEKGPDNKLYAVAGEVAIDTSEEDTPKRTIPKMELVRTAALAPADPSSTDYQVASTATMIELKARLELSKMLREELEQKNNANYSAPEHIVISEFVSYA